jgi:hypothetical protein
MKLCNVISNVWLGGSSIAFKCTVLAENLINSVNETLTPTTQHLLLMIIFGPEKSTLFTANSLHLSWVECHGTMHNKIIIIIIKKKKNAAIDKVW